MNYYGIHLSHLVLSSSSTNRSNQQEAEFIYFRLLAAALVQLNATKPTKNDFLFLCYSQYSGNISEFNQIEEFNQNYSKTHAIRWYTRDSFLYRMLNNALRLKDIDI